MKTSSPRSERFRRVTYCLLILLILSPAGYLVTILLTGNLHTVVNGQCYRSGQLSAVRLADCCERYDIKTILNLRGPNVGDFPIPNPLKGTVTKVNITTNTP